MPLLSFVTGTRNRPVDLHRLIGSLQSNTRVDWELVIADASDKPVQLGLDEETAKRVRIIPERPRLGCTKGLNRAFAHARGEWIMWLNDDCIIEAKAPEIAIEFMELRPHVGLGCLFYGEPGKPYKVNSYFSMVYANFGILKREFGNAIGWLDEDFPMYGNDNALAFKVLMAGKGVQPIPQAAIYHFATDDIHRIENDDPAQRERDCMLLVKKYGPHLTDMNKTYVLNGGPVMGYHDQTPHWAYALVK